MEIVSVRIAPGLRAIRKLLFSLISDLANFLFADDPDTSSSRLETDAGVLEATAARHSHRQEQYLAASSFVRLRPQ
jgi:hypothetical protein